MRPFDARRDGLALGEGAALMVVESAAHAERRGARAAVEVAGAGLSADAVHMTAPARDGAGAARAMRAALADAGLGADAVDVVSAHGTGTVFNDAMEMAAIPAVFGPGSAAGQLASRARSATPSPPPAPSRRCSAPASCARAWSRRPQAASELDPACTLDVVRGAPRRIAARVALSTSSAFAGNNAAVVFSVHR